jgi:hypothetical protein
MFTRGPSAEPKTLEPRTTRTTGGVQPTIGTPSTGEKSVIGNDLKIIGQGLKIIGRGLLQVDGEIEGDVHAAEVIVGEKGQVSGMTAAGANHSRSRLARQSRLRMAVLTY